MDTQRLILFLVFSFSILLLWDNWERQHAPQPAAQTQQARVQDVPAGTVKANQANVAAPVAEAFSLPAGQKIHVKTDMVEADIDTQGGDLRHLELLHHKATEDKNKNFVLFDDRSQSRLYVAQSGLIGADLPTHKSAFTAQANNYELASGSDKLEVRLSWRNDAGLQVDKVYTFHRGSYVVDLRYDIHNGSAAPLEPSAYFQLVHDSESSKGSAMMPTFSGAAFYTEADKYKKLKFDDMKKSNLSKNASDGWIGMVQHYFASAWIPKSGAGREYYTKDLGGNLYSAGAVTPVGAIAPGASGSVSARLYAGPQEQKHLKEAAPGLEYTVDYGWLTVIASPLFWVLTMIQKLVHNWGAAIILLTVLLKLLFFPLSAASYKSMAHMRKVAPRLQQIKERYGDDREKLHQAMMELYKTEKINPMGGCLPIVVQIPVFIALYWVLLGSVEMRHAPFILWIQDLSATDPYYVLPILMGATMLIQSSLNPPPPDPIQAKVMKIMPVAFSVFFFFFPAGLVLYWLVNNILSIAQQWAINRSIEGAGKKA
ncbi:MAG TPA: membrane protein insertase YidC [Novimethylophilus sp.]|jgi:YidC/Oxa1 family membrane protein insertase|uniref:membrane protein insertase YidC n=1 Tax=Novimethylophilus sp. TaxID=2137426 RepID=UPI002F42DAB9